MNLIAVREIAHARSGEKGPDSNVAVIAYDMEDYPVLARQLTVAAAQEVFGPITDGQIVRYEVPNIGALNFVLPGALRGGRSRTLAFDESGKALSSRILAHEIQVDGDHASHRFRQSSP